MQTYTLKELAEETGVVTPRLVQFWKSEKKLNGALIKNDVDDEGNTVWWLEPTPSLNHAHGAKVHAEAQADRLTLERAKQLRREKGPAAVDVSKLAPEDKEAFLAWLKEPQVTMSQDEPDADAEPVIEISKEWLVEIDGIGSKGAEALESELLELNIGTFEELNAFSDLTTFTGIGKKNGENLRAAIVKELGAGAGEDHPLDTARQQLGLYNLICSKLGGNERAKEIAFDRVQSGEYDRSLGSEDSSLENVAKSAAMYCKALAAKEGLEAGKVSEILHEINCPHCSELFDRAKIGAYESCEATCLDPETGDEAPGYCGKLFWLEASADGYKTHEKMPETGITIISQGEVTKEVSNLIPDGGEPETAAWPAPVKTKKLAIVPASERIHPALIGCRVFAKTETHSPEWHAARAAGVGSSDAGAVIGVSPYATTVDVWKTKIGEETDRKPWLEEYAEFGTWFEPYIREFCEIEHGIEIIDGADIGTLQSAEWPRALANIDGLDITHGVVEEYKTTTEKWTTIPAHYEAQVQHQMFVTGVHEIRLRQFVSPIDRKLVPSLLEKMRALDPSADRVLADWLLEHGAVHTWIVERDESYIERMIAREKAFWAFVEMEIEPVEADPEGTVDLSSDPDVYAACVEYARLVEKFDAQALAFLKSEGVEPSKRGSVSGSADKVLSAAKKKARKAIDKAVSLLEERPKRLAIGGHSATYVDRGTHAYWNIYTSKEGSDAVPF